MTSEIENTSNSDPVGKAVTKTITFFGVDFTTSSSLIFQEGFQRAMDDVNSKIKLFEKALLSEREQLLSLEEKMLEYQNSNANLKMKYNSLSQESQQLKQERSLTNSNFQALKSEKERLEKANHHLAKDNKQHQNQKAQNFNLNRKLQAEINSKIFSLSKTELENRDLGNLNQDLEMELKNTKSEAEQKMKSMQQQSLNNEKYLQQVFAQRNSPAALQLLQNRINAPPSEMDPDELIFSLPIPCLKETVQRTHQSVATMKISAAIFSKENGPASVSQDACGFGEVEGGLAFAVADGVSTSNRQSEWAKRLVTVCISPEKHRQSRFTKAQLQHKEDGEKLTALIDDKLAWVWEEKLAKQSDATLLTGQITPDGHAQLHRRGDTWAAMKKKNGRKWHVIFPPSVVNGTQAVNSHSPLVFDESTTTSEISKLLIMTDGVASTDSKFLEELWDKVTGSDPNQLEGFVSIGRQENTFENDDITIVAIDTRGFRHN